MKDSEKIDAVLDRCVRDDGLELDAPLRDLLVAARRARRDLPVEEAAAVFRRVTRGGHRQRRRHSARGSAWLAGVAALLAITVGLLGYPAERRRPASGRARVVERVRFEGVHEGKVARLEIIVHEVDAMEEPHDPSL